MRKDAGHEEGQPSTEGPRLNDDAWPHTGDDLLQVHEILGALQN
eukprot:CAMPEP_0115127178 /NCGR_PEP_ID=MMETSP0227-20121206/50221_1 /TAXON_ID=89957 /ORGANISM="Polarella glacialis, Strain CCMP 1383" /LENGTH=43 /DNA_ID= /DNA_START= /DNA_END= /DNA_ORIENTATION=